MSRSWQKHVAIWGIAFFAIFVQCAAVCSAVVCETPKQEASCPNHPEPQSNAEKICKDINVVKTDLHLDFALLPAPQLIDILLDDPQPLPVVFSEIRDHSPPNSFTILRV